MQSVKLAICTSALWYQDYLNYFFYFNLLNKYAF